MAKSKLNWQENYAGLLLGAIIVVILGLLVANFITNRSGLIEDGDVITEDDITTTSQQYTVEPNDSLSKIAEKIYGDIESWPILAKANNIANPNIIHVGTVLEIPSLQMAEEMKMQMSQTSYEVNSGDTLFIISEKMYGSGYKWKTIAQANNVGHLPNGNPLIFSGSTLVIPR